jgi:hypothetical protein
MANKESKMAFNNLPGCAADYIRLIVKKMRWQKKARADVQAELTAHFEDALKDCKTDGEKERKAKEIIDNFGDAKLIAALARRAKKRCRPLWQKTAIKAFQTLGVIIGLFILYVAWFVSGRPEITTNYVEAANKMMKPKAVDDSQNAAPYYEKAAKLIEPQNKQIYECVRKSFIEASEANIIQIRQWLDKNREALKLIEQGTEKPYYWQTFQCDPGDNNSMLSVLLPYLGEYRTLAYGLRWRAYLSAEDKQYEKAFADLLTIYKFGKHQKTDGILVQSLVGTAIEALSVNTARTILYKHDIGAQQLESFYNNLQTIVCNENFVVDPSIEKLTEYDEIQRCFTESHFGFEHIYLKRLFTFRDFLSHNDRNALSITVQNLPAAFNVLFTHPGKQQTRQMTDAFFDFWEQAATETPFELKGRDLEKETTALIKGNFLLKILAPAMQRVAVLSWRNKAEVEGTLTIIEILRFKQEKGRLPDDLQELVTAGYLKSLPIDPYSDKPLVYKKTQNGFTYYSLGQDFNDNGGKAYETEPGKYKIWADANDGDAVFWPVVSCLEKSATNAK